MSVKKNLTHLNDPNKENRFQLLKKWVIQYSSFNNFIKEIWLQEEKINKNPHLRKNLEGLFPSFECLIYSNHQLILQILEERSFEWHDEYLTVYQDILLQLKKENSTRTKELMKFLASTKVGIQASFYEKAIAKFNDKVSILEFSLLNIIRSQYKKDTDNLDEWANQATEIIKEFIEKPSQSSAEYTIYQLPLLGLLWHKEQPTDFIYKCIDLSFYEIDSKDSPELHQHLQLYFRNALVELCERSAWKMLSKIKRYTSGWSNEYFKTIFSFQSMQIYTEQINQAEKILQEEQLNENVSEKIKKLDKLTNS